MAQLDAFAAAAAGRFGVSHFILIDSLNFVFELLGATNTYLSLLEQPDLVRRAVDFAFDLNVLVQDTFFERAGLLAGGTASNMVQWIAGRIVSESVDPFHMTSVDYFEAWGREPVERILSHYDGGVLHIHGNGRHLLEAVSSIRGLKAVYLGDDRGFSRAFDVLSQLQKRTGDVPLVVSADWHQFTEGLRRRTLPGGVLYQVAGSSQQGRRQPFDGAGPRVPHVNARRKNVPPSFRPSRKRANDGCWPWKFLGCVADPLHAHSAPQA